MRAIFQTALESVHLQFGAELEAFHGDSAAFERARPILETCLVTQYREPAARARIAAGSSRRGRAAGLGAWALAVRDGGAGTPISIVSARSRGSWSSPARRRDGRFFVGGLRDPLAATPRRSSQRGARPGIGREPVGAVPGLAPAVRGRPGRDLLRPPPAVTLAYDNGVLTASGAAPERWIWTASGSLRPLPASGVRIPGTPPRSS